MSASALTLRAAVGSLSRSARLAASMLLRSLFAASQSLASKPRLADECLPLDLLGRAIGGSTLNPCHPEYTQTKVFAGENLIISSDRIWPQVAECGWRNVECGARSAECGEGGPREKAALGARRRIGSTESCPTDLFEPAAGAAEVQSPRVQGPRVWGMTLRRATAPTFKPRSGQRQAGWGRGPQMTNAEEDSDSGRGRPYSLEYQVQSPCGQRGGGAPGPVVR